MWIIFLLLCVGVSSATLSLRECVSNANITCFCEGDDTLRCKESSLISFDVISEAIQGLQNKVKIKFLDFKVKNAENISSPILEGIPLTGLVISFSDLKNIEPDSFVGLKETLQALGLPSNKLQSVPTKAISKLPFLIKLDLSSNLLQSLDEESFKGVQSLEELDLSRNSISNIQGRPFEHLENLTSLVLGGNRISNPSLSSLKGLKKLRTLVLSENEISGPLTPDFLPELPELLTLHLENNKITSVTRGTLSGVSSLMNLSLTHNTIDVIEDFAFESVCNLTFLDLSHNNIITISNNSLACLGHLEELDLSHNNLITISQDLMLPLESIRKLYLDFNDIAKVDRDAMKIAVYISFFSVKGNPFNCDCDLQSFASWLATASVPPESKATAVCRTPPELENAEVYSSVDSQNLCDPRIQSSKLDTEKPEEDKSITLKDVNYNGDTLWLQWGLGRNQIYKCFLVLVFAHHAIQGTPYSCSTFLLGPNLFSVSVKNPSVVQGGTYKYCIILVGEEEKAPKIYGCSQNSSLVLKVEPKLYSVKVQELPENSLSVEALVWPEGLDCTVRIDVKYKREPVKVENVPCNETSVLLPNLPIPGPYQVCLSIGTNSSRSKSCYSSRDISTRSLHPLEKVIAISAVVLVGISCIWITFYVVKNILSRRLRERNIQPYRGQVPMKTLYRRLENSTSNY